MARLKFLQTDFLLALFVVLQISGCSLFSPKIALHDVTVDVEPLANNNTPLYVDFVAAGDEKMLERLKGTPASQWFEQRAQLQRDYPQGFSVWSLEVVPGQFVRFKAPPPVWLQGCGSVALRQLQQPWRTPLVTREAKQYLAQDRCAGYAFARCPRAVNNQYSRTAQE